MIEKPDLRKLTTKEKKFIKHYIEHGNKSQAALAAGYKNVHSAWVVLQKDIVQNVIEYLMDQKGLSEGALLDVLSDGIKADKVISANVYIKSDPNNPDAPVEEMKEADGVTKDFIEVPDHATRHKYLVTAMQLRRMIDKWTDPSQGQLVVNGNINFVQQMIQRSKDF